MEKKRKTVGFAEDAIEQDQKTSKPKVDPGVWTVPANEAIFMKLVNSSAELDSGAFTFAPALTHQLFEAELIRGYKGLKISIYYCGADLQTYLAVEYKEKQSKAEVIEKRLLEFMPPSSITRDLQAFRKHLDSSHTSFKPHGKLLSHFDDVQIYVSDFTDAGTRAYHERLQIHTLWFIDGANYIELDDPKWRVFYMFQKAANGGLKLMGFITAYRHYAYHRTEENQIRLRVSQVLVFPPFQRRGFGAKLYNAVWEYALADSHVQDITVEDPVIEFTRVRDVVDIGNCIKHGFFTPRTGPLTAEKMKQIRSKLKLCKNQIRRIFEILRLKETDLTNRDAYKQYRLIVKARLYKQNSLDVSKGLSEEQNQIRSDEIKVSLDQMFRDVEAEYQSVIAKLK